VASVDDAEAIAGIYGPAVSDAAISFEYDPPDADEMRRRIATTVPDHPWLVATNGDTVVGYAYAHAFAPRAAYRWSVETSVYVDRAHHGAGVGRRVYGALFRVLALQGYRRAFAGIALPNPASVGLHEAMGFTPVGTYENVGWKLGAWHDVGWWQRDVGDAAAPPETPRPLTALPAAEIAAALGS
jgi:L-amino acid N-acyltransferase YncA